MGLIRSGLVVTVASVLFLSLFLGNAFLTLDWSLEYETVQPHIVDFTSNTVKDLGIQKVLENGYPLMQLHCQSYPSFIYSDDSISMEIPCDVISQGVDPMINYGVEKIVEESYYREYNCSFFKCLKEENGEFVLVSKTAKDYWNSKFKLSLIVSVLLIALLVLIMEKKHASLTITGILMVVAALPFRKLNWVINLLPDGNITDLVLAFFTKSYNVFLIMIIIGVSLFAIGIAFEFLGFGLKFSKFIGLFKKKSEDKGKKGDVSFSEATGETFTKEEVAEIVREELEKDKKKKKLRRKVKSIIKKEDSEKEDLGLSI